MFYLQAVHKGEKRWKYDNEAQVVTGLCRGQLNLF